MKRASPATILAGASESTRALNPHLLAVVEAPRRSHQQAKAKEHGDTFEHWLEAQHSEAIRLHILARIGHYGPPMRCLGKRGWIPLGKGPPDYLGTLYDGRSLAVEAKHLDHGRLYLDAPLAGKARDTIPEHQANYLDAVALAGGVAMLVVEIEGVRAAIPWRQVPWRCAVGRRRSIGREDVAAWAVGRGCYLAAPAAGGASHAR